jgi:hypothetical protein
MDSNNFSTRKLKYHRNIYPDIYEKILFGRRDKDVITNLKSQADLLCRSIINKNYINYAFDNFHYGYYYKNDDNKTIGFCIWEKIDQVGMMKGDNVNNKYNKVLLMGAVETDFKLIKIMLCDIESYALPRRIRMILLEPVSPALIPYYEHHGYNLVRRYLRNDVEKKYPETYMFKHIRPIPKLQNSNVKKTMKIKKVS